MSGGYTDGAKQWIINQSGKNRLKRVFNQGEFSRFTALSRICWRIKSVFHNLQPNTQPMSHLRLFAIVTILSVSTTPDSTTAAETRPPRARDLGIPFKGTPGPLNAITDVAGVLVGHSTIIKGSGPLKIGEGPVRTGVTAILPTGRTFQPIFAAWSTLNGNGEMTGTKWIEESGFLEEPILLTNTHSVGQVAHASISWRAKRGYHPKGDPFGWAALPVVAETWDGRLNDIHGRHIRESHVFEALDAAQSGPVAEGNVGGGTGMICHQFKSGIGAASRKLLNGYTVGVLVQANYGRREDLTIAGINVGRQLTEKMPVIHSLAPVFKGNSLIAIVCTDAPLLPHQLKRIAKRVPLGIGRTGGFGSNSSGDIFLAFSTAVPYETSKAGPLNVKMLPNAAIDPFFQATVQATEEAIINALVAARDMTGINGNTVYELPHQKLIALLKEHKIINE
ncbi:MAG: Beta-peptidyl aminopeptidase BapA [Verrucomicrobia subdivision 3 bacterium]|nr:Beta-peptidyl aminopeptidase BapA [Limisphaerales bacterium]MCS1414391.1 Beta-peptidyl aminopeptidase BapA [Limisphaerales bacterium]